MLRAYQSPASGTHCGLQCAQMPNLASRYHSGASYCRSESQFGAKGPVPARPGMGDCMGTPSQESGMPGSLGGAPHEVGFPRGGVQLDRDDLVAGDRGKGALGFRSGTETGVVEVRRVGDIIRQAARKRLCGCHGCCGRAENFAEIATTHFDSSCCGTMHEYGYSKPAYSTHPKQGHGMSTISNFGPDFRPERSFAVGCV